MNAVGVQATRRAIPQSARDTGQAARQLANHAVHIKLRNVPRSAIPADVRRAVARAKLQGVSDVAIDYLSFMPTESAFLTLTRPEFLRNNLRALEKVTISCFPIYAQPALPPILPGRPRGAQGRAEAKDRGLITGTGPHGGVLNRGKNVTVWGLPGKLGPEALEGLLNGFKVAGAEAGHPEVVKIFPPERKFTMVSRFLIHMSSISEAHRLVRRLHLTHFQPEYYGPRFLLRARVVY